VQLTGAQALLRCLRAEQVGWVFGIASGKLTPLLHALSQTPEVRFIGLRHEAAGAMMAAAVFASTGRVAVALGEMAPGGINLASGAGVAFNNHLAALLITTNQHRAAAYPHRGMFMDMDTRAVFAPLTKWSAVVGDVRRIPELVRTAFRQALGGRPGPVHLDIPQDVLAERCEFADDEFDLEPARYRSIAGPRPAAAAVSDAVALLRRAQRPLIVAGGGAVVAQAQNELRQLAERLRAPLVPTQMGLGIVASDSDHCIGQGGLIAGEPVRTAFGEADLVLAFGCRHSSWLWDEQGPFVRRAQQHIHIDIEPSALGEPAVHTLAVQADSRAAAIDLLAALGPDTVSAVDPRWLPRLREQRVTYERKLSTLGADETRPMHPAALARAIGRALPSDALAVFDGGHTSFWSNDLTPVHDVRTRFHDPGMCQLGYGLPFALALQLAHPGRAVFNITGDGSFGFTLQELDTARRCGLPVITLIHNNAAWGIIAAGQRRQFDFELGTELTGTDYAAITRGFGCHGESIDAPSEVAGAIDRARASGLPAVIDCRTRFEPHPCVPAFGAMNRFGFA
jgi:thiamine pyrophosphate-dependent acetolactate synthase large subunit-like protein